MSLSDVLKTEMQKWGIPAWIAIPAILTESSGNPNATNGQYRGLLQIGPGYPGVSPSTNLYDPQTNLDVGFAQLRSALAGAQAHGLDVTHPNQATYDYVLTHSGHPSWDGSSQGQLGNFDTMYRNYELAVTSHQSGFFGPFQDIADWLNAYTPGDFLRDHVPGGSQVGQAFADVGSFTDLLGWFKDHPGFLVAMLLAGLVFLGSGFALFRGTTQPEGFPTGDDDTHEPEGDHHEAD